MREKSKCEGRKRIIGFNNMHKKELKKKIKGHGENRSAASAQGENRMHEGENIKRREN